MNLKTFSEILIGFQKYCTRFKYISENFKGHPDFNVFREVLEDFKISEAYKLHTLVSLITRNFVIFLISIFAIALKYPFKNMQNSFQFLKIS